MEAEVAERCDESDLFMQHLIEVFLLTFLSHRLKTFAPFLEGGFACPFIDFSAEFGFELSGYLMGHSMALAKTTCTIKSHRNLNPLCCV